MNNWKQGTEKHEWTKQGETLGGGLIKLYKQKQ